MLSFLFPRLTDAESRGAALFASVVAEARRHYWYSELGLPDTLDGRFSVLATVTALATVRLERGSAEAQQAAVALAERFIESMDHEHRQMGYGDPTIGKIVRRLTGSLARRVSLFRAAVEGDPDWSAAASSSLKAPELQAEQGNALRVYWERLLATSDADLLEGKLA